MRRPVLVPVVLLVMALVIAACETAQVTPAPGDTPPPGVDTPPPVGDTPPPAGDTPPPNGATAPPGPPTGGILAEVRSRGELICGVNSNLPGFGFPEEGTGRWLGFDADYCRAVAAAVLGNPEAVQFRPLSTDDRSIALQTREIDVLIRNTTWTLSRDTEWGLFAPTTFYDGQGMMVRADSGVQELTDLQGATICVQSGTTTELTLPDQMNALGVDFTPGVYGTIDETYQVYESGACDAVTSDRSQLVARRTLFANPDEHVLLDEVMSKEPLGPSVPFGDAQWFNIVKWVVFATIQAEEVGVDSTNVAQMRDTSTDVVVLRLLGAQDELGAKLGLDNDWVVNVITGVGNYGEIYNRHLGPDTPFNLPRGPNELWTEGGLLYAPPLR
ncbi:MAG TPA: amino acid ABC transporter substrate-binding protein [Candidatus Limnocylindria bacterium]|nr:amino acid ABC transporter substrate-binding protein [Candidatus Limnocylindria bacterium]